MCRFCLDFGQILSRFCPVSVQILSRFCPDLVAVFVCLLGQPKLQASVQKHAFFTIKTASEKNLTYKEREARLSFVDADPACAEASMLTCDFDPACAGASMFICDSDLHGCELTQKYLRITTKQRKLASLANWCTHSWGPTQQRTILSRLRQRCVQIWSRVCP